MTTDLMTSRSAANTYSEGALLVAAVGFAAHLTRHLPHPPFVVVAPTDSCACGGSPQALLNLAEAQTCAHPEPSRSPSGSVSFPVAVGAYSGITAAFEFAAKHALFRKGVRSPSYHADAVSRVGEPPSIALVLNLGVEEGESLYETLAPSACLEIRVPRSGHPGGDFEHARALEVFAWEYQEYAVPEIAQAMASISQIQQRYAEKLHIQPHHKVGLRCVRNFALLRFALECASLHAGCDWPLAEMEATVDAFVARWAVLYLKRVRVHNSAREAVKTFLTGTASRFSPIETAAAVKPSDHAGYTAVIGGHSYFLIEPDTFKSEVGKHLDINVIIAMLRRSGLLLTTSKETALYQKRTPHPTKKGWRKRFYAVKASVMN